MIDDYEAIEDLSKVFQENVVSNQKKLNEVRQKQFQAMVGSPSKVDFKNTLEKSKNSQPKEKSLDFQRREKSQIIMLVKELDERLRVKVKNFEDNSFKMNELMQQRVLLKELEKKRSQRINDALKLLSDEYETPLTPLLVHVDMLLQKQELSEKQKNHLKNVKENVLSCLDIA